MSRNHYMKEDVKVHPALTEFYATTIATKKALTAALKTHTAAAEKLNAEITKLVDIPAGHHILVGDWACPTSPIGMCIYDAEADRFHDDCLYCHEPSERT